MRQKKESNSDSRSSNELPSGSSHGPCFETVFWRRLSKNAQKALRFNRRTHEMFILELTWRMWLQMMTTNDDWNWGYFGYFLHLMRHFEEHKLSQWLNLLNHRESRRRKKSLMKTCLRTSFKRKAYVMEKKHLYIQPHLSDTRNKHIMKATVKSDRIFKCLTCVLRSKSV